VASPAAQTLRQAAKLNLTDPRRKGNVVYLDDVELEFIVAGDIHGQRQLLAKTIDYASLGSATKRVLLLQELIHGPMDPVSGHDRSIELLLRAARLKVSAGQKLVFVMGNHELAQLTGNEITKQGRGVCKSFAAGVRFCFAQDAEEVLEAMSEFTMSMPLAVRCANGVMLSHSLPDSRRMATAGLEILDRPYQQEDLIRGGPVYEWTWGRTQDDQQTDKLADQLGVNFFVLGHRRIDQGWEMVTTRAVALASDHEHGCLLRFRLSDELNSENIASHIRPLAALGTKR